jgi:hypothetical protein
LILREILGDGRKLKQKYTLKILSLSLHASVKWGYLSPFTASFGVGKPKLRYIGKNI